MKNLIQKFVQIPGPSGYESQIRQAICAEIETLVDEIRVDAMGSLIARKGEGGPDGKKIMLSAHMDEIGLIVTHIDDNGFARFIAIGGVAARYCLGGRVRFLNGAGGVIGSERMDDPNRAASLEHMYIDLGASKGADSPVKVGDVAVFERPFSELGNRLVSKAMDDRVSVAVMVETIRRMAEEQIETPHQVYFVFSVQEEVGLRGATTAAYGLDPDLGLAVDVTGSGDTPKGIRMATGLGKGPAIKVRDSSMLADPRVVNWMVEAAEKAGIPYQMEVLEFGGTDAHAIQLTRAGVPAGCLSIPCRYVHSPSEMVDMDDVQNAVRLLIELIRHPVNLDE